jgi:hypothetical protein
VRELQDEIELVDLLALEAIRVFMPDTFEAIHGLQSLLTSTRDGFYDRDESAQKAQAEGFLRIASDEGHGDVARAVIERLFPAALRYVGVSGYGSDFKSGWLKARRVAHADILGRYLERVSGEGMDAFLRAERIYAVLTDRALLEREMARVEPDMLEDVIAALEIYEHDFPVDSVLPAVIVLFNTLPLIPVACGR